MRIEKEFFFNILDQQDQLINEILTKMSTLSKKKHDKCRGKLADI